MINLPCPHCREIITKDSLLVNEENLTFHKTCMIKSAAQRLTGVGAPRQVNIRTPQQGDTRARLFAVQTRAMRNADYTKQIEQEAPTLLTPNVLLPAIGGLGGGILEQPREDEEDNILPSKLRGAVRGLAVGSGAALGQSLAGDDMGSRLGGGMAGGALAYLLSKRLLK